MANKMCKKKMSIDFYEENHAILTKYAKDMGESYPYFNATSMTLTAELDSSSAAHERRLYLIYSPTVIPQVALNTF